MSSTDSVATTATAATDSASAGGADSATTSHPKELHTLMHSNSIDMGGGKQKSFWGATMETLGMADGGKTRSTDTMVDSLDEAVSALQALVDAESVKDASGNKWTFPHTPFADFDATPTDLLTAFCKWAREKEEDDKNASSTTSPTSLTPVDWTTIRINVTKAFRRLTSYVNWVDDQVNSKKKHLNVFVEPLDVAHMDFATVQALGFKLTHDKFGRLVWWFDMADMDRAAIKDRTISILNIARYMVWIAHVMLFDVNAQDYGFVFVEDLRNLSLFVTATLVPMEVSAITDRLTMGVLPLKMKQMVVLRADTWMNILMSLFKPFMSAKLRKRIRMVSKSEDGPTLLQEMLGGNEYLLKDSCDCVDGELTDDLIFGKYFREAHLKAIAAAAAASASSEPMVVSTAESEEATC